jgi:ABC-type antimicrobial peptide transport system permease subunit
MPADAIIMRTIVGVVREVRTETLVGEQPPGQFYVPFAQQPVSQAFVVARGRTDPVGIVAPLRSAVAALDPQIPLFSVYTMEQRVAESLLTERARTVLLVGFASIALLLAAVGLYGVLAYGVAQRQAEIGIRMALGSTERAVFGLVLRQGLALVAIGLVIGVAMSAAGTRALAGMLHGVSPVDPTVWLLVLLTLAAVATAACLLPAWRAMRVSPATVLKEA